MTETKAVSLDPELESMLEGYRASGPALASSRYWAELSEKHIKDLQNSGYSNFKRTLAMNYFTVLPSPDDPQVSYLKRHLPAPEVITAWWRSLFSRRHSMLSSRQSVAYNFVTYMLWEYVRRQRAADILSQVEEPREGNPLSVRLKGKEISQDIAHSALEFASIRRGIGELSRIGTVIELGAGYGRTAFVFMKMLPGLRYIIVDIPPALYVSQRYLSSVFPERKIFKFRPFTRFTDVARGFGETQLAFLIPGQLELLPEKTTDLFLAIDSLHEMRPEQIANYFDLISRVTKQYFYFKCWKKTKIPYDGVLLAEADYPVKAEWKKVFWRDCDVLTLPTCFDGQKVTAAYFEALCQLG